MDELYDGPFCVLSIVDNRCFKRLIYEVLDHDPTHEDIIRFFKRFKRDLDARSLTRNGITTDGSAIHPIPITEVFGTQMPHQVCEFHVVKQLNRSILHAVAKIRKQFKCTLPALGRGRPAKAQRRVARRKKRIQKNMTALFGNRYLFVKHGLTPGENKTLMRITRGLPQLRTLRHIVDEGYRLFNRRCRTDTAIRKLAKLRGRVRRFKRVGKTLNKLFWPNLQ